MHLVPVFLVLFASYVPAQEVYASSENFVAIAPVQPGGAERATSSNYNAQMKHGLPPSGEMAISTQYVARAGTAAMVPQLVPGPPLVFAVEPGSGDKGGAEPVTIRGLHLDDGSGTALATLGGASAVGVTTTNTVLTATTGPGKNVHGNPLGEVDAQVVTAAGSGVGPDLFVYTPALTEDQAPRVGEDYPVDVHAPVGSFYQLAFGVSIPGVAAPVPPLAGAAEILLSIVQLTPLTTATASVTTLPLPIPDNPTLIGVPIELQAAVITGLAPLAGTFTNLLATAVQP